MSLASSQSQARKKKQTQTPRKARLLHHALCKSNDVHRRTVRLNTHTPTKLTPPFASPPRMDLFAELVSGACTGHFRSCMLSLMSVFPISCACAYACARVSLVCCVRGTFRASCLHATVLGLVRDSACTRTRVCASVCTFDPFHIGRGVFVNGMFFGPCPLLLSFVLQTSYLSV